MSIDIDDGVMVVDNFLSQEQCYNSINYFEKCNEFGFAYQRPNPKHVKDDKSVRLMDGPLITRNFKAQWAVFGGLSKSIKEVFNQYMREYSILQSNDYQVFDIKIQKTPVGGGYHIWHDDGTKSERAVVFIIYLNDVQEGGETEFLYKAKRISSKAGRLVFFPSDFMYTHRGNPPISNEKYILTGWIEYV